MSLDLVAWNDTVRLTIEDEKTAELFLRAAPGYHALPNIDRLRISGLYLSFLRLMEQQHLHIKNGDIDPKFFESGDRSFMEWFALPGVHEWWSTMNNVFSNDFQLVVEERIAEAKKAGYNSSFKRERDENGSATT